MHNWLCHTYGDTLISISRDIIAQLNFWKKAWKDCYYLKRFGESYFIGRDVCDVFSEYYAEITKYVVVFFSMFCFIYSWNMSKYHLNSFYSFLFTIRVSCLNLFRTSQDTKAAKWRGPFSRPQKEKLYWKDLRSQSVVAGHVFICLRILEMKMTV